MFNGTIVLDPRTFTQAEIDEDVNRIVVTPEGSEVIFKRMINEGKGTFDADGNACVPSGE